LSVRATHELDVPDIPAQILGCSLLRWTAVGSDGLYGIKDGATADGSLADLFASPIHYSSKWLFAMALATSVCVHTALCHTSNVHGRLLLAHLEHGPRCSAPSVSWCCHDESQATRIRRQASQLENCDLLRVPLCSMPKSVIALKMMLAKGRSIWSIRQKKCANHRPLACDVIGLMYAGGQAVLYL
jgi:hypothetical protein